MYFSWFHFLLMLGEIFGLTGIFSHEISRCEVEILSLSQFPFNHWLHHFSPQFLYL